MAHFNMIVVLFNVSVAFLSVVSVFVLSPVPSDICKCLKVLVKILKSEHERAV